MPLRGHKLHIRMESNMGKKPLTKNQIEKLRIIVKGNPLHELLLNLGIDLMLRSSDLLALRVSDVIHTSGKLKDAVSVKQKKTGKTTLAIPLLENSKRVIEKYLKNKSQDDFIFTGSKSIYTQKSITSQQYARIVKCWMKSIGIENIDEYSTHSLRKSKASAIYEETHDVDAVRRLLGQSSITATSAYLGVSDNSALELAKSINL
tara:strand:- start:426 stop:1040 length:615 start_codon:yes stop_codon:yes gene_type:complete